MVQDEGKGWAGARTGLATSVLDIGARTFSDVEFSPVSLLSGQSPSRV